MNIFNSRHNSGNISVSTVTGSNVVIGHGNNVNTNGNKINAKEPSDTVTIDINNGVLIINNEEIAKLVQGANLVININGDVNNVKISSAGEVNINQANKVSVSSGNINADSIKGNVELSSGNIKVNGSIGGNVSVITGNINYRK